MSVSLCFAGWFNEGGTGSSWISLGMFGLILIKNKSPYKHSQSHFNLNNIPHEYVYKQKSEQNCILCLIACMSCIFSFAFMCVFTSRPHWAASEEAAPVRTRIGILSKKLLYYCSSIENVPEGKADIQICSLMIASTHMEITLERRFLAGLRGRLCLSFVVWKL